jgi:hypothetical protein
MGDPFRKSGKESYVCVLVHGDLGPGAVETVANHPLVVIYPVPVDIWQRVIWDFRLHCLWQRQVAKGFRSLIILGNQGLLLFLTCIKSLKPDLFALTVSSLCEHYAVIGLLLTVTYVLQMKSLQYPCTAQGRMAAEIVNLMMCFKSAFEKGMWLPSLLNSLTVASSFFCSYKEMEGEFQVWHGNCCFLELGMRRSASRIFFSQRIVNFLHVCHAKWGEGLVLVGITKIYHNVGASSPLVTPWRQ